MKAQANHNAQQRSGFTVKYTADELKKLRESAQNAGLKLGPYLRRETLRNAGVSDEIRLVLGAVVQLQELMLRLFAESVEGSLDQRQIRTIANDVRSIRTQPLVAALIDTESKGKERAKTA
jgi:hypothetical protein